MDLLTITTKTFCFQIRGKQQIYRHDDESKAGYAIKLYTTDPVSDVNVKYCHKHGNDTVEKTAELIDIQVDELGYLVIPAEPLLFEETNYEFHIELNPGIKGRPSVHHVEESIRNAFRPWRPDSSYSELTGNVNFKSNVGFSKFDFFVDDDEATKLTVVLEVFPSKVDYKTDYQNLLTEVRSITYNLVFDFLKKTYLSYDFGDGLDDSPTEFFSLLEYVFADVLTSIDRIIYQPYHQLVQEHVVLPKHKLKRTDAQTIKWLIKHNDKLKRREDKSGYRVEIALGVKKYISYDNKENRFVKYILLSLKRLMHDFYNQYSSKYVDDKGKDITNPYVKATLDKYEQSLDSRLRNSFLAELEPEATSTNMSLVFAMAPGYTSLLKDYLLLLRGLNINIGLVDISLKNLWQIYEYWCFIKLNYILKDEFGYKLVDQDFINIDRSGVYVKMVQGNGEGKSAVAYKKGQNTVVLTYNDSSVEEETDYTDNEDVIGEDADGRLVSVTTTQRPDNVFKLTKTTVDAETGEKNIERYIFDAKYRVYSKNSKSAGPVPDTINTMHRYKDAIVTFDNGKYVRQIKGAYVLFPMRNEAEYLNHKFLKSINIVDVGGLPFLPDMLEQEEKSSFIESLNTYTGDWLEYDYKSDPKGQMMLRLFLKKILG